MHLRALFSPDYEENRAFPFRASYEMAHFWPPSTRDTQPLDFLCCLQEDAPVMVIAG